MKQKINRKLSLLIIISIIASTLVMPMNVSAATNLFPNGSFEDSDNTLGTVGTTLVGSGCTVSLGNVARTGSKSASVTASTYTSASANSDWLSGLETGATYKATAYVKLQNAGTANTMFIKYRDTSTGGAITQGPIFSGITADAWTPISYEFTATSPNYQLQFCCYDKLDYYIDDISVVEVVEIDHYPQWGTFEGITELPNGLTGSGATVELATDGQGANGSQNYVKVTGRTYQDANINTPSVTISEGKAYRATFYVRLASGAYDTTVIPQVKYTGNGAVLSGTPVTAHSTSWTKCEVEFAAISDFAGRWGQSISMRAHQAGIVDLWYDDFKLEEIAKPALTTAHDLASTTDVDVDAPTVITVDFSNNVYNFSGNDDPSNTGVSTDQVWSALADTNFAITNGATIEFAKVSDKQATLTITDLDYDTEYSITVNGLTDYYGNTLTDATVVTFTTEEEPVIATFPEWGSFEGVTTIEETGVTGSGATVELATDGKGANGSQNYVTVTGRTYQGANISVPGITIEEGKAYKATFYVRLAPGVADTTVTPQVNYTGQGAIFSGTPVTARAGEWTRCEVKFAATSDFAGRWGQSIAMKAHQAGHVDLWYDDFKIEEIAKPALTTAHDLASTTDVDVDAPIVITVDFSNNVYNFTGKEDPDNTGNANDQVWLSLIDTNFAITGGIMDVSRESDNRATITITDLDYDTEYSITVDGLTDYFGNTLTNANVVTFTTEEEPVIATFPVWGSFEGVTTIEETGVTGSDCTVTLATDGLGANGSQNYIKVTGRQYIAANISTPALDITEGKAYKATFYVRLAPGVVDTTVTPQVNYTGQGAVFSGDPVIAQADEWIKCEVEFTATADFAGKWGQTIAMKAAAPANVELWYDDFKIEEIAKPVLTMSHDLASDTDVDVDAPTLITVDFSNNVYNFSGKDATDESGYVITSDQAFTALADTNFAITGGATMDVEVKSNKQAVLTITDLDYDTSYTVTVNGLTDYFGNTLTDANIVSFITESKIVQSELYPLGSFERFTTSDELSTIVSNYGTGDRKYTLITDGNGANGTSNYIKMSDSTWSQGNFQTVAIEDLTPGKTYRATVYLKNPNSGTITSPVLRLKQMGDVVVATSSALSVSDTGWTKVTLDYTLPANDTKKNLIIQIQDVNRNDIYVDEVSLEEYVEVDTNTFPEWGSFEGVTTIEETGVTGSGATVELATDGKGANGSQNYVKVTGRQYQGANIATPAVEISEGKAYKATFYVRLASGADDTTVTPQVKYTGAGAIFSGTPVTVKADEWTRCEVKFAATSDFAGRWGQSVMFRAYQAGNLDLWYDEFKLEEITKPTLSVSTDLADGAQNVTASTKITVDFSNPAYNFSGKDDPDNTGVITDQVFTDLEASNFELTSGGEVAGSVMVTKKSGTKYELTLAEYDSNTTYTITVKNIRDYFGNKIESQALVTFTTGEADFMPYGSFEDGVTVEDLELNSSSFYTATITDAEAKSGTHSLLISDRADISNGYYQSTAITLEAGQAYKMSAWVKLQNAEDAPKKLYMDAQTIGSGAKFRGEPVQVTADEWTQATVEFVLDEDTRGRWGYIITARAFVDGIPGDLPNYYIDDVSIVKIDAPTLSVSTDLADGAQNVTASTKITVDFSNPAYNFSGKTEDAAVDDQIFSNLDSSNFELTCGGEVTGSVNVSKISNTKYELTLSGYKASTAHTINIKNVRDYFGNKIESQALVTFTTDKNLAGNIGIVGSGANVLSYGDGTHSVTNKSSDATVQTESLTVEPGKKYVAIAFVKKGYYATSAGNAYLSVSVADNSLEYLGASMSKQTVSVGDDWIKVVGLLTTSKKSEIENAKYNLHIGINTTTTDNYMIKGFELRELSSLDINTDFMIASDGSSFYLHNDSEVSSDKNIYVTAATYDGRKLSNAKMTVSAVKSDSVEVIDIPTADKYFIWDADMKPLCTPITSKNF